MSRAAFLRLPTVFWAAPSTLSALPPHSSVVSPVALPTVSLTEPCTSFAVPSILSIVPCAPELLERRTMLIIAAPARTIGFFMISFSFPVFWFVAVARGTKRRGAYVFRACHLAVVGLANAYAGAVQ